MPRDRKPRQGGQGHSRSGSAVQGGEINTIRENGRGWREDCPAARARNETHDAGHDAKWACRSIIDGSRQESSTLPPWVSVSFQLRPSLHKMGCRDGAGSDAG
ncbi:hypothetical protein DTW92_15055 [Paracoccus pantotrophus]|nr:hypothetical protein DTW92_15055 [Paracoccus pantotrophus]